MVLVADVMTANPVCLKPEDYVTKARSLIRELGFRALPVVDGGRLVGVVSRSDVMLVSSSKANITVEGVMSRNTVSVSPGVDLFEAARLMAESSIRQLPVVDDKLVGIISSMDVLSAFVEHGHHPVVKQASRLLRESPTSCSPDEELSKVWVLISESGASAVPVVEKDKVVGVVTSSDLLRHGAFRLSLESGKPKNVPVRKAMASPAVTLRNGAGTAEAARVMVEHRILRLPVVDEKDCLTGLIDALDVLRAYTGK